MARPSRLRLRFITTGFLAEMRKQFAQSRPDEECPIGNLADYSPEHRSALMAGLELALKYGSEDADKLFNAWVERQLEEAKDGTD